MSRKRRGGKTNDGNTGFLAGKLGLCSKHGRIRLPCTICAAERYRAQHPEHQWVDPLPELNAKESQADINECMKFLAEVAERMPGVWHDPRL